MPAGVKKRGANLQQCYVGGDINRPKVQYRTEREARAALRGQSPHLRWELHEFKCRRCGRWHLGHRSPYARAA